MDGYKPRIDAFKNGANSLTGKVFTQARIKKSFKKMKRKLGTRGQKMRVVSDRPKKLFSRLYA